MSIEENLSRIAAALEVIAVHVSGAEAPPAPEAGKPAATSTGKPRGRPPGSTTKSAYAPAAGAAGNAPTGTTSSAAASSASPAAQTSPAEITDEVILERVRAMVTAGKRQLALDTLASFGADKSSALPQACRQEFLDITAKEIAS